MTESAYLFKLFSDDHIQFIDENAEKIKIRLSVDEANERVQLRLLPLSKVLWSGRALARPKITPELVSYLRTYFQLSDSIEMDERFMDQARIHPRFAMNFNRRYDLLHQLLFEDEVKEQELQHSYGDGLSFMGNAILQFVASLIVFYETTEDTSNEIMEENVRKLVEREKIMNHCLESGWSSVLAYNAKRESIPYQKGLKVYSDQLKGWLGALYASNSVDQLPDVLEIAKKMLSPETELSFESLVKQDYDRNSLILGGCVGFGVGMFAMVLVSYLWMYHGGL